MSHPLLDRLSQLRRQTRRLLWLHALAWVVGLVVGALIVLGVADYLTRFNDRGMRYLAWLTLVGIAGWVVWQRLRPAMLVRLDDLYLAKRIEARFPLLANALTSTIEFLHQSEDDPQAGSPLLRRTVVQQTTMQVERLDFSQSLNRRSTRMALLACGWICFIAAWLACLDYRSTQIALTRIVTPWADVDWPKQNHLLIRNPVRRIPLGQPFEIEVVDAEGAALPADASIHYRFAHATGPESARTEALRRIGDLLTANLERVERPFSYRVTGGDDDQMPWIDLEVVEPPAVSELSATLHYPEYTGWPATPSEPHVRALAGTRIALVGTSTKPLKSVTIEIEGGAKLPAVVGDDKLSFTLAANAEQPLVITASGAYRIDLEDAEGFHGHRDVRYDLRSTEDRPPTASLEQPAADGFVTADAVVPIRILAKDDLALARVELSYLRSDQSDKGAVSRVLWKGAEKASPPEGWQPSAGPITPPGESRVVEERFELKPLELKPGTQLTLNASAIDYRPQVTQSHARRLTVISATELQERLAERQAVLLGEMARVLKLQRDAKAQLDSVDIQLNKVDRLTKSDVDHLQQAELMQRQIERSLTSKADGLPAQIASLLSDLRNNRLDQGDTPEQMQRLQNELARLAEQALPGASRELVAGIKDAQSRLTEAEGKSSPPVEKQAPVRKNLAAAAEHQNEVVESLEQLLGDLNQWDTYRRFHREIGQLQRDQQALQRETAETGQKTLTKSQQDLTKQEAADLEKLATRQTEVARQLEQTQQRMAELANKLRQNDPVAADTLQDAIQHAQEKATSGKLREASKNVGKNQIGQAAQQQEQAGRDIEQMLDILSQRREHELGRLVKKLREAEQQLDQLRKQQAGLRKKLAEAEQKPNDEQRKQELERLTREQRELQQQAERFARQLQRLQADQASRAATRGGAKMGQAGQQAQQGDAAAAGKQAEEAMKDLEEAAQQLAERRKQAEQDLANEQASQIQDLVKNIIGQQERLLTETKQYDDQQAANGRLTRAQSQSVQDLSRQQSGVSDETTGLAAKLTGEAFKLAIDGAAREMTRAAERLGERDVSATTQRHQQLALSRARRLLAAFADDDDKNQEQKENQGGAGGGDGDEGQQGPQVSLAELKLLKLLQEDLNERSRSLEEQAAKLKVASPDVQREYVELGQEQGRLADLLIKLTTKAEPTEKGEGDLKKLLEKDGLAPTPEPKPVKPPEVNND